MEAVFVLQTKTPGNGYIEIEDGFLLDEVLPRPDEGDAISHGIFKELGHLQECLQIPVLSGQLIGPKMDDTVPLDADHIAPDLVGQASDCDLLLPRATLFLTTG